MTLDEQREIQDEVERTVRSLHTLAETLLRLRDTQGALEAICSALRVLSIASPARMRVAELVEFRPVADDLRTVRS